MVVRVGNPDRCKIAGSVAARQLDRIAAIRLYPVAGFDRNQCRGDDFTGYLERRQLPVNNVAGRASFVTCLQRLYRPEFCYRFAYEFQPVRNYAEPVDLPVRFGKRNRDGLRVDVQTNKSYLRHATNSIVCDSASLVFSDRSVNPRTAMPNLGVDEVSARNIAAYLYALR